LIKYTYILIIFLLPFVIRSQTIPNSLRNKTVSLKSDTCRFDTLSVIPGTFKAYTESGRALMESEFRINYVKAEFILIRTIINDSIPLLKLVYRVIPINLSETYSHKDTSLIIGNYTTNKKNLTIENTQETGFIDDKKLDKNGSISRGFAIGNQRDLMSLSNLNLQLSGKLNDEVSILAAISDNNIPIQPEGNTQQIQEFDKIYIQLLTQKSGIKLGDIELNKPFGYFMNLKKQTRGIQFYSIFEPGKTKKFTLKSDLSAGLAKGKYTRLKIQGIEGNQGPYRLIGSNNETYIMVLSGSEKVFIDGRLMVRGDKFDYVIDYNSAEIVFTSNQPITKDSRITVEFEYAQQFYPRLQALQTNYLQGKKSSFWFNIYSEKDNKNDPLSDNYNDSTKMFLSNIGDSIQQAFVPGYKQVPFDNNIVLYELTDTLVNGFLYDSVFRYSTNPERAKYQLGFSYVGENMGNYRPEISNANGKVYKWIALVNGVKQGNYEPVTLLVTPKKNAMANLGGQIKTGAYGNLGFEMAFSNFDVNTYSAGDDGDDKGLAFKFNIEQGLLNSDTGNLQLKLFANYQMASKNFKPIENYYDVEFERDWNIVQPLNSWQEQQFSGGVVFQKKNFGYFNLSSYYMQRQNDYTGKKVIFSTDIKYKGFQLESQASYLQSSDLYNTSDYLKHKLIISKHFKPITIGISEESEQNSLKLVQADSLQKSSFQFSEYSLFIHEADSAVNQYFINYKYRNDYMPGSNKLQSYSTSQTAQAGLNLLKNRFLKSKTLITYRKLDYTDSIYNEENKNEDMLSGRQEINIQMAKSSVQFNFFYETASGLEIKKEYIYVEVQKGQGQYTWIDYNNNNIKELEEFEFAKFADEADHIRLFIPGNEYLRVYTTQLNQSISIQPDKIWMKKTGFRGFISSFSDQFAYRIMQKTNHPDFFPGLENNNDLISQILILRNNFSFKSKNRKWQADYLFENNYNRMLLLNGIENRNLKDHSFNIKWKIINQLTFFNKVSNGLQSFNSEYFSSKNYHINYQSDELSLQLQPSESFYSTLQYRISQKQNQTGPENSKLNEIKLVINQIFSSKINIQADIRYVKTKYNGEVNSSVAYEMLEGLKAGQNIIWSVNYNHKLSKILQLSIGYNGRTAENSPTIHNGNIQLMANF